MHAIAHTLLYLKLEDIFILLSITEGINDVVVVWHWIENSQGSSDISKVTK